MPITRRISPMVVRSRPVAMVLFTGADIAKSPHVVAYIESRLVSDQKFSFLQQMPLWITVVLLGIIEGITEFLPVSSTGHLLIAERWLPRQTDLFNIVIQCGAVLAVLPLFSLRCQQLIFRWREAETRNFVLKIIVAFGITGVGGLMLEKRQFKLPEHLTP